MSRARQKTASARLPDVARLRPPAVPPLRPRVDILVKDPCPEGLAVQELLDKGRHLARQDAWDVLSDLMCTADRSRQMTPGLRPVAAILAEGARSDVMQAVTTAIAKAEPTRAFAALTALDANREDDPDCNALAYIVASAHVAAATAWRGASHIAELAPLSREAFRRHMAAAQTLSDRFDPFEMDSALWAMLRCSLLDADPAPTRRVCDDYEDLVDLDPRSPDNLRAMGRDLLPNRYGSFEILDAQARRAAIHLRDVWGLGAYTWIWIGAMEADTAALRRVDVDLFREGLRDIVERRPDQHMINRLAAFTGVTVPHVVDCARAGSALSADFEWIAGERMTELHPRVWALASAPGMQNSEGGDAKSLSEKGRLRAVSTLAERFADRLTQSGKLIFAENGLQVS